MSLYVYDQFLIVSVNMFFWTSCPISIYIKFSVVQGHNCVALCVIILMMDTSVFKAIFVTTALWKDTNFYWIGFVGLGFMKYKLSKCI